MIKRRMQSTLDTVIGLGKEKRKRLFAYFGGFEQLMSCGVSDLQKVSGIGAKLAKTIYAALHKDSQ